MQNIRNNKLYLNKIKLLIFFTLYLKCEPFSIQFSIPENKIVKEIPQKDRDFAFIIPGDISTYIYNTESEYYKGYQRSYYAITKAKGGWDCMRHYEILANGCIPYFLNLDKCDPNVMFFLPKDLIHEAMNLEGVSYGKIDHTKFNEEKYLEILNKLLDYTRKYLTTKTMAEYLLRKVNYSGNGTILFLTNKVEPDYMPACVLSGLKEIFKERVVDYPKITFLYKTYSGNTQELYGKGMTYSKVIDDLPVDRRDIETRIKNKEFDLIIYGSIHRGLPFHDLVKKVYSSEKIVYICGEDCHQCPYKNLPQLFLREFNAHSPLPWPH